MPRNVQFSDEVIEQAAHVAPSFEFSKYAQAAVREKLDRDKLLRERMTGAHR